MSEHPETADAFMRRVWSQDKTTLSDLDYSTLVALAMEGARALIAKYGHDVAAPGADADSPPESPRGILSRTDPTTYYSHSQPKSWR